VIKIINHAINTIKKINRSAALKITHYKISVTHSVTNQKEQLHNTYYLYKGGDNTCTVEPIFATIAVFYIFLFYCNEISAHYYCMY